MLMYTVNLRGAGGSANLFQSVWPQKASADSLVSINPLPEKEEIGKGSSERSWGQGEPCVSLLDPTS